VHRDPKFSAVFGTTLAKSCKTKDKSESAHATHALQEHKTSIAQKIKAEHDATGFTTSKVILSALSLSMDMSMKTWGFLTLGMAATTLTGNLHK
jgi:hypothetical protein